MKKKILITYLDNKDFKSTVGRKVMLQQLTDELISKGKELNMEAHFVYGATSTFTDGTEIISTPLHKVVRNLHGVPFTHMYIDNAIADNDSLNIVIGWSLAKEPSTEYDISGKQVNYFTINNNQIELS